MQRITTAKVRYWLFTSLLLLAPLSKYPSIATPLFNFSSFRLGLYQLLLVSFVLISLKPMLSKLTNLYKDNIPAFVSILALASIVISGLPFAIDKPRSLLLVCSTILLLIDVMTSWWYVRYEMHKDQLKSIFHSLLIAGCVYGVLSILQFLLAGFTHQTFGILCKNCGSQIFGFPRISGFAAEPQFHANAMLVYYFAGLGAFYHSRSRLGLSAWILSLLSIGLTLSRGAFLAAGVSTVLFYVLLRAQKKIRIRTVLLHVAVIIGVAVITIGLLVSAAEFRYRNTPDIAYKTVRSLLDDTSLGLIKLPARTSPSGFEPAGLIEASAGERLDAAKLGINAWSYNLKTTVFGVGSGNLGPFVNKHINPNTPSNLTIYIYYILILAELGVVGLLALLILLFGSSLHIIKGAWEQPDTAFYTAFFCLMAAFLIQYCFFGSYINVAYIWVITGIGLGIRSRKTSEKAL